MTKRILVMGLPGSGKTYFAEKLKNYLISHGDIMKINPGKILNANGIPNSAIWQISVDWFNADEIRKRFNDWDFSDQGRERQAIRMMSLANLKGQYDDIIICDFVCPLQKYRDIFDPDILVYMNTIDKSRYEDTNSIFEPPIKADLEVLKLDSNLYAKIIFQQIVHILDKKCN